MKTDSIDPDLERRFRAAMREVMPQLEALALEPVDDSVRTGSNPGSVIAELPIRIRREDPSSRHRVLGVAASLVAVVGLSAALMVVADRDQVAVAPADSALPATTPPPEPATGSLLTTSTPPDVQPMMVLDRPGWSVEAYSDVIQIAPAVASATCAGCGADRLVVAADDRLFGGPVFTAWTIDDDYALDEFDWPVTIGSTPGRFIGSHDGSAPAAQNHVRAVWPLGPGRTAFVDAYGFSNEQVFAMAATLTFDSTVPTLADIPAGLGVVPLPPDARLTQQAYVQFTSETAGVAGYSSSSVIELIVTDGGIQGLLDWRNPGGLFGEWGTSRIIDGAAVMVDHPADPAEPPILAISATWTVGGWNYAAIGHVFNSEDEFLDVVAGLRLADAATFATATATAGEAALGLLTPSIDGSSGVLVPVDP